VQVGNEDCGGFCNYFYTSGYVFSGCEILRQQMYVLGSCALSLLTVVIYESLVEILNKRIFVISEEYLI
jgi:hypothetical protein